MAERDLDGIYYVKKAPTIRFEQDGGVFFVCYDIGRAHFEFVMRPKVFSNALLRAEDARAKWQYETMDRGNVRDIKS